MSIDEQQKNKKVKDTAPEITTVLSSERKIIKSPAETKAASNKYSITFRLNNFFSSDEEDKFSILSEILLWFLCSRLANSEVVIASYSIHYRVKFSNKINSNK
ncbi:hypothetical protein [Nostoc sp. 'Peltigera malacea cyanobiont' DB3992]|uniref:hypothetical protein n=1 Tax=Nostoc sp. 'Peltigera malacea cyanobiont' DB3992 TaxID=1206980 RepID=UPI003FA5E1A3